MSIIREGTVIMWYGPKACTISIDNGEGRELDSIGDDKRLIPWLKSRKSFYKLLQALAQIHELHVRKVESSPGTCAWKFWRAG